VSIPSHLGLDIGSASAQCGVDPAKHTTVAHYKGQDSAAEQNANAWGAMTPGSDANRSGASAGEGATSPRLLREATARNSAVVRARTIARNEKHRMRLSYHKISDCAADATNICRSLPLGSSLATTINLKNVEAPKVEPPRQLQMHSGQRVTSRGDSDQDKSFQKRSE